MKDRAHIRLFFLDLKPSNDDLFRRSSNGRVDMCVNIMHVDLIVENGLRGSFNEEEQG